MDIEKLQRDLKTSYKMDLNTVDLRVENIMKHITDEWNVSPSRLTVHEMQTLSSAILERETQALYNEVEALIAQKERLERELDKKYNQLQESKYTVFNILESQFTPKDTEALTKLHQIKLQTIDLYDLLSEIVESAIITTLEKDETIDETIDEVIKHITYEAIKEGSLDTLRIRKILSTILQSAIDIAEASPLKEEKILTPTLRGMRSGLISSITRFKQRLAFIPIEAKHILIEDYDTIIEDLNQTDSLFAQVIQTQAEESTPLIQEILIKIKKEMRFDLDELLRVSKETADVMKDRFSSLASKTIKNADKALHSSKTQEAKRIGKQVIGIAKNAISSALKSAQDVIEKK